MNIITKIFNDDKYNKIIILITNNEKQYSNIVFLHNKTEKNCILLSLHTEDEYRNMGYGSILLKKIIKYCIENEIREILLDDCTDNFNKPNNIYLKSGFKYINEGEPEMIYLLNN